MSTRTDALTVSCPFCHAPEGEPCTGPRGKLRQSVHAERHVAFLKTPTRHPADLSNWTAPAPYHEPSDPLPGMREVPITDDNRERGLRHLRAIRNQPEEPPW